MRILDLPGKNISQNLSLEQANQLISAKIDNAAQRNIRLPILIKGDSQSLSSLCKRLAALFAADSVSWVSSSSESFNNFFGKKANIVIGKEYSAVFFQFNSGSDPNLFAALAGTVKGGGIFVICIDDVETTVEQLGFFESRILSVLEQSPCLKISAIQQNYTIYPEVQENAEADTDTIDIFAEQNAAIQQIMHVATGRAQRPLVLTAQRGRGKSAALGVACAHLLNQQAINILVTAPSLASATVLFKHFRQTKSTHGNYLQFIAPDELIATLPEARLVIVDEAAALPTPILKKILDNYSRVVFATTTHGYEGSGQSFAIRFKQYLQKKTPAWKAISLETPIRWSALDPLEPIINQLFLLSTSIEKINIDPFSFNGCRFFQVTTPELVKDEKFLQQVASLLQFAHYRTRPSDLKQLLNNSEYKIFIAYQNSSVIGVALGIGEGPLDINTAREIYQGKRRPVGDLLPQTLLFNLEHLESCAMRYLRLTRIAVHPDYQGKGVGTALLKQVDQYARDNNYDAIGSSFGATPELLLFWLKRNYSLLRIGYTRNASSAMHAALVIKFLNPANELELKKLQQRFLQEFEVNLTESLQSIETEIVHCTLHHSALNAIPYPTQQDWQSVYSYSFLNRNYEDCLSSMQSCLRFALFNSNPKQRDYGLLIQKVYQRLEWKNVTRNFHFSGKKQTELELRAGFAKLIIEHATSKTKSRLINDEINKT